MTEARTCGAMFVPERSGASRAGEAARPLPCGRRRRREVPVAAATTPPPPAAAGLAALPSVALAVGCEMPRRKRRSAVERSGAGPVTNVPPTGTLIERGGPDTAEVTAKEQIQEAAQRILRCYTISWTMRGVARVYPKAPSESFDNSSGSTSPCSARSPVEPEYPANLTRSAAPPRSRSASRGYDSKVGGEQKPVEP